MSDFQIYEEAKELQNLVARYRAARRDPDADKLGLGFSRDSRFPITSMGAITLDGWIGYYGNSGCGILGHVDPAAFQEILLRYLNKNIATILEGAAELAIQEHSTAAQARAEQLRAEADALEAEVNS